MPVSYVARKCSQCAGKLEYIKEKKTWKCLYCGAEIERTEQYDGLYTIKNVVKQVLLDIAYRRLDSAQKNLVECEKIDSRYIGTIIAKLAYQLIIAITPGANTQAEIRNLFLQLKRSFDTLQAIDKKVSGDEEALYEFFDSADVYATLLLVYDSLNDVIRRDYVARLLNAGQVYAKESNKNLLSYGLKNAKFALVDELMGNPDNTEPSFALDELLKKYPDNENKIKILEGLLNSQTFRSEDNEILKRYLVDSNDSLATKGKIVVLAYAANIKVGIEDTIAQVLLKADLQTVRSVLCKVCSMKMNDEDVYKIVEFAISAKTVDIANVALDVLKETNQYVLMTTKYLIAFLSRNDLSASDKTDVLKKLFDFNVDAKSKDSVISHYLCFNQDAGETRLAVIHMLISMVSLIQTRTIENYIIKINTDGANKPGIVEQIFALDLNKSFFDDLLGKYLNNSPDIEEVKDKIVAILTSKGLKIDPKALIEYICHPSGLAGGKIDIIKKMLLNGTKLRDDTVNAYLETVTAEQFNSELFALIVSSASNISDRALSNYLLLCKDRDYFKVKNFTTLIRQYHKSAVDIRCDGICSGQKIAGNILSVYLLATPDSFEVTKEIADYLIGCKAKLNADIQSSIGSMKLKKFVSANKSNLSSVSKQICETYKVG